MATKGTTAHDPHGAPMSQRHATVVAAATEVFLQHGYRRATMGDIARGAWLTRPTLYLSFPDKKSIFQEVIRSLVADKITQIEHGLTERRTFEERLVFACQTWALGSRELTGRYPNAQDLFDRSFLPVAQSYEAFEQLLESIVRDPLSTSDLTVEEHALAAMISNAVRGFADSAQDQDELCGLIQSLGAVLSAALGNTVR